MTQVFYKAQLALVTVITVAFLWATMPGHAHAQSRAVCDLIVHPVDPRVAPQLKPNVKSGLDKNRSLTV